MQPQYLRVKNWEHYQHYKDRRPTWIKFYVELLDDYELISLDVSTRLLFDCLLLIAARTDNNIPNDPRYIAHQVTMEPVAVADGLEKLLLAGFLVAGERKRSASKQIAKRRGSAMPEKRREEDQVLEALDQPGLRPVGSIIEDSLRKAPS